MAHEFKVGDHVRWNSRRYPQFAQHALERELPAHGIGYRWLPKRGGRRKVQPDSPNTGWRNASFRGYADYLASSEFAEGLDELLAFAALQCTTLMCAELLWWRCHRSLIADVLRCRGVEVIHILDAAHSSVHPYTSPARIVDGKLSYAAAGGPGQRSAMARSTMACASFRIACRWVAPLKLSA